MIFVIVIIALFLIGWGVFYLKGKSRFTSNDLDCYYINLNHREDRKSHILKELGKINVNPIRIEAVYEKEKGHLGCSKSHIKTIEQFINSGKNMCIVVEDEFELTQDPSYVNQQLETIKNIDFDVIMLSATAYDTVDTVYPFLKKVLKAYTTSGYIVSKKFAPVLLNNFKEGAVLLEKSYHNASYAVDQYWHKLQPQSNWFIFNPTLGKQIESMSDTDGVINPSR
jgi:GR25 family glycosyltransferase involved in LPS biosynthesis